MVGSTGNDFGYGLAVDSSSGSVYVTGSIVGSLNSQTWAGGLDIFLMKYTSSGTVLWTRMAGTTSADNGYAVAVDTSSGDVYVAGSTQGSLFYKQMQE